jgi:plastocyanin
MSLHPFHLLLPVVTLVLLTACSSSEQETSTMATPESTTSTAPSTSPAPSASPAPATSASAATAQGATITIEDFDYTVPPSIAAGAQVQVVNNDGEAHTVTIPGGPSIVVPPRGSTMTFSAPAKAGTYDIICDFHGNMTAQLVIA